MIIGYVVRRNADGLFLDRKKYGLRHYSTLDKARVFHSKVGAESAVGVNCRRTPEYDAAKLLHGFQEWHFKKKKWLYDRPEGLEIIPLEVEV